MLTGEQGMIGRILLDDEDWTVTLGLLGGLRVTLKWRNLTIKASKGERDYLLAMIDEFKKCGIPISPDSEILADLLRDFSEAVFSRNGARWDVFFLRGTPQQQAHECYLGDAFTE
jgi:hypothetical protein